MDGTPQMCRWVDRWIDPAVMIHIPSSWSLACLATNTPLLLPLWSLSGSPMFSERSSVPV